MPVTLNKIPRSTALWVAAGIWAGASTGAIASVVFSGSATNPATSQLLSASAAFDIINSGTQLQITLTSLGVPVHASSDILTTLFFDLNGVGTLTPVSAVLNSGSTLLNGPTPAGTTLGDYWEYAAGLSCVPNGATRGIAAAGFGLFGKGNFGSNGENVDGFDYGIVNGSAAGGNDGVPSAKLENNSVVFTLRGLPVNFSLDDIAKVGIQYGTTLSPAEPLIEATIVPEPSSGALLSLAGLLWAVFRRKGI